MSRAAEQQQDPQRGGRSITVLVVEDVLKVNSVDDNVGGFLRDLIARDAAGFKKYGQNLETHDGRDSLLDAYQEALDLVQYLRKALEEGWDCWSMYHKALAMAINLRRFWTVSTMDLP